MNPCFRPTLLGMIIVLAMLDATVTHAATFNGLAQARSVAIGGQLTLNDFDTGETFTANQSFNEPTLAGNFGLFDKSVGLGTLILDNPLGIGQGAGRAAQTSRLGPEGIEFDGVADVFMSGQLNTFNADLTGSGGAASRLSYSFSLAHDTSVLLDMISELGPRANSFTFSLSRDDGTVIWNETSVFDDDGNEHRAFTRTLLLNTGVYNLESALNATSFFVGEFGFSGRALATYSLTAVPLGNPLLLMGSALVLALGQRHIRVRAG